MTRCQKGKADDGTGLCTIDYEATLTALGDVMVYRPRYLEGQEFAPLTENNSINLENIDKFYKAYLDRNSEKSLASAAEFNQKRGTRITPKAIPISSRGK